MAELTEVVAGVAEGVAEEALVVAGVSRSLSGRDFGLGLLVGGSVGSALSFWAVRRWLETKYSQMAEDEIDVMRIRFRDAMVDHARVVATKEEREEKPELERIVQERGYVPPPPGELNTTPQPSAKEVVMNVHEFTEWDYEEELASRTPDSPYVIHRDEYKESEFTGVTLTYYEGDDVLCDDRNQLVENKDTLVGEDNLNKFGHGSGNSHIVYIRNEGLSIDIELIKNDGTFVEAIHGLRHSAERRRRIRFDDAD